LEINLSIHSTMLKFEQFNEASGLSFEQPIDIYKKQKNLDIYNAPKEFVDIAEAEGKLLYEMRLNLKSSGIEDISVIRAAIRIDIEIQEFDEKNDEDTFHNKSVEWNPAPYSMDVEFGSFPLYLQNIEIDMKKSEDPEKWKVTLKFGGFND